MHRLKATEAAAVPKIEGLPFNLTGYDDNGYLSLSNFVQQNQNRNMNRGELTMLFRTADLSKKNRITKRDWETFYWLFVIPFEKDCDTDKNY